MFRSRLADGDERRGLGQSVNVDDRPAQFFLESLDGGSSGGRAGRENSNSFRCEAANPRRIC